MSMRHASLGALAVLVVLALVAAPAVGGAGADTTDPATGADTTDSATVANASQSNVKLVYVAENESSRLWPYTSRRKDFETLTLPINVVIRTDAAHVRRILAGSDGTNSSWTAQSPENETVVLNGTEVPWSQAHGATRYTYIATEDGGQWLDETYQLHNGTYFGSRIHLRLYDGGTATNPWTAIQAHDEHFDWFRLRHTVSSVAEGRKHVERDFYGSRYLADIERQRYANGGIKDTDGWVTVIEVVKWTMGGPRVFVLPIGVGLILGLGPNRAGSIVSAAKAAVSEIDLTSYHAALTVGLAAIPLGVRIAGITLETRTPLGGNPALISAMLYPVLAVGIPLVAVEVGRYLPAEDGFAFAALGLGLGLVADYAFLAVTALPVPVVLNRVVLLLAVGLLAAGGTPEATEWPHRHRYSVVGAILWIIGLAWPLFELGALFGMR